MSRICQMVVVTGLLILLVAPMFVAQQRGNTTPPAQANERPLTPVPPEKSSITSHEITLDGKTLKYTATAGNLLIRDEEDQPNASFFYVAYTLDGVSDLRTRPLTFLYNGGPGSASMWLHMGSVGPARVRHASPHADGPGHYPGVSNPYPHLATTGL